MKLIYYPTDLTETAEIGGKGFNMSWMSRHGLNVPGYFILGSQLLEELLRYSNKLDWYLAKIDEIEANPDNLEESLELLRDTIKGLPWSPSASEELTKAMSTLKSDCFVAVRSSISDEDAKEASFAGQMDSFLYQKTPQDVQDSYLKVMASMFSYHAVHYRTSKGLPLKNIKGAAIVQVMIDSQVAGVMFTAHPSSGSRRDILISAVYGQGEGLVSGICNADEFTVNIDTHEIQSNIAHKDLRLCLDSANGSGTIEQPVAEEIRDLPCLSTDQIQLICKLGLEISSLKSSPQDIEWAIQDGILYVLQTRPITHLPPPANPRGEKIVWDNSNIQESYCGVTTPLTFSYANRAYKSVYSQTLKIMGTPPDVIAAKEKTVTNLLGLIHGRVYYNINNWYDGLSLLPSFKTNKSDMEKMMGLQDPVDFVEDTELSSWQKIKKLPMMVKLLFAFLVNFAKIDRLVDDFLQHFKIQYARVDRANLHRLEVSELFALYEEISTNLLGQWHTPIINDFFVMMMNGKVGRHLKKAGFDNPDLIQNNLMSGEPGVESTEPTKYLMAMAAEIRGNQEAQQLFETYSDEQLWDAIRIHQKELFKSCEEYVELYGDRCMGELKLESISLRQDPRFMFSIIRNFMAKPELSLEKLEAKEQEMRQSAELEAFALIKKKRGLLALRSFKRDLQKLRKAVKYRENMRFSRTRSFGLVRSIYTEIGEQLCFYGLLDDPRDIFYLTVEELEAYHEGRSVQTQLKAIASARKIEWQGYEAQDLPHHFATQGVVYYHNDYKYENEHSTAEAHEDGLLKGTGCYPGVVREEICKIFSPQDQLNLNGRILCTVRTDPGWTPLFPSASGILVERGSTLSHSAVIARELGIPAIVGIPGLTQHLEDAQRVEMDGANGTIRTSLDEVD